MNVLWLSSANILFNEKGDRTYNGKGWIGSLADAVQEFAPQTELSVAFISSGKDKVTERDGITYYSIKSRKPEGIKKLMYNWTGYPSESYDDRILEIANMAKPDVIHVFGAESKLSSWLLHAEAIPTTLHIQGILTECIEHFFSEDIKPSDFLSCNSFFNEAVLRNGYLHLYNDFKTRAAKERKYLSSVKFAMGRTDWDRNVLKKLSSASYSHVDEVLRPVFYKNAGIWKPDSNRHKKKLLSTISEMPYKGIDTILKTAVILKKKGIEIEWNVAGVREDSALVRIFEKKFNISGKENGVRFIGVQNEEQLVRLMESSDIYIHPSHIENSPNSLCEAQMTGIPTIAAASGGTATIADYGKASILYNDGDCFSLSEIICNLAEDCNMAEKTGIAGQKTAARRHDRKQIVTDLLTAYNTARKSL